MIQLSAADKPVGINTQSSSSMTIAVPWEAVDVDVAAAAPPSSEFVPGENMLRARGTRPPLTPLLKFLKNSLELNKAKKISEWPASLLPSWLGWLMLRWFR